MGVWLALFPGSTHLLEQQALCETQLVSGPGNEAGGWYHTRLSVLSGRRGHGFFGLMVSSGPCNPIAMMWTMLWLLGNMKQVNRYIFSLLSVI